MPPKNRISLEKQIHEISKYLNQLKAKLIIASSAVGFRLCPMSMNIYKDAIGELFVPSRLLYEKTNAQSKPLGLVFHDDSFLTFKEVIKFGYKDPADSGPRVYPLAYGYHYQRPADHYYFRFDHHPLQTGIDELHPEHHLHSSGWQPGDVKLPDFPRFEVNPVNLDYVLNLIRRFFPQK